jgi:hypothetical protein
MMFGVPGSTPLAPWPAEPNPEVARLAAFTDEQRVALDWCVEQAGANPSGFLIALAGMLRLTQDEAARIGQAIARPVEDRIVAMTPVDLRGRMAVNMISPVAGFVLGFTLRPFKGTVTAIVSGWDQLPFHVVPDDGGVFVFVGAMQRRATVQAQPGIMFTLHIESQEAQTTLFSMAMECATFQGWGAIR